jgi:aryl sulfotransferase
MQPKLASNALPMQVHRYQNHLIDCEPWDRYNPRAGDVVIATSYKSGTTWMQGIVAHLLFPDQGALPALLWPDARFAPPETMALLEAQTHRRIVKMHLPLDGLPYYPEVRYIVVNRDARDVFMSFWNHYSNLTPAFLEMLNHLPDRVGPPLPQCSNDIHECWHNWITRGWFDWESEGYPWWGNLHHTKTWWDYRHLPNILFVHFNDLLNDLLGELVRVAYFLDISVSAEVLADVVGRVTLEAMRRKAQEEDPGYQVFKGGAATFFYKGTNGRWQEVLSMDELALYHDAVCRVLSPDCVQWLENGRSAR